MPEPKAAPPGAAPAGSVPPGAAAVGAAGAGDPEAQPPGAGARPEPKVRLRLSRRGMAVLAGLVAAVLGTVCWLVWFSSVLDVRTVAVSGTRVLTVDQVLAAADIPLHGPLERLDTGAAEARVARALPRVARVRISTSLPHTVRVRITERVAIAAVKGADGRFTQVDASGAHFATGASAPAGVPVVQLALSAAGKAGLKSFPERDLLAAAVDVAKALPAQVAGRTSSVIVHSYDDLELQLADGSRVLWGSSERDSRKAVVLTALLRQKGTTYDVSAPDDPAVRH
ncbi:cell division protein FtsQ/DivIB [Streptacidiphilus sp. N1-12]|uniref:Cell division protein FtsQ/DivIB n=2 Tax=Streptacidiphilus alkalitolerans TaxID=3342712 RepID=A0ABV6WAS0_9ACTN